MYARVITTRVSPENVDEVIRLWRDAVAPTVTQQQGFKGARLLVEPKTGSILSMGLWETEADLQGSVGWNQEQLAKFASLFTGTPRVEHYQLVGEV